MTETPRESSPFCSTIISSELGKDAYFIILIDPIFPSLTKFTLEFNELQKRLFPEDYVFREGITNKLGWTIQLISECIIAFASGYSINWKLALIASTVSPFLLTGTIYLAKV